MRVPASGSRERQRGAVLVLVAIGAVALVGMAGLALDLGNAYLARTRLQNALDAAALSGARTLSGAFDAAAAETDARQTFTLNNGIGALVVETSATLLPFSPGSADPRFVRVSVPSAPVPATFSRVLGIDNLAVGGTAVAGPIPLDEFCGAFPVGLCGVAGDSDCTDGSCFGIEGGPDAEIELYGDDVSLGPGNYALLRLSCSGGDCLREAMAGGADFCFSGDGTVETQPGVASGPATQGLNTRFGIYRGGMSASEYPPDAVTDNEPRLYYEEYRDRLADPGAWDHADGVPQRRMVTVPIIDCSTPINGASDVDVLGGACMFLTRPMEQGGDGTIYAQLAPDCLATGRPGETPDDDGPKQIILYQDPLAPGA